jgi:hypothetical protein
MDRRAFLGTGIAAALSVRRIAAQPPTSMGIAALREAPSAPEPFARLKGGPVARLMPEEEAERVTASPAPPGPPGRWTKRAWLPIARSEMNWGTAWAGRLHVIGAYGEGRVDRAYYHIYDPAADGWFDAAPPPRGINQIESDIGARARQGPAPQASRQ